VVLDGRRHQVAALRARGANHALDRQVVALRRAAGKHDLAGLGGPDRRRNTLARIFDGGLGSPAVGMGAARSVAELLVEVREHRLDHAGIHWGGGVVVEIDGGLHRGGSTRCA